MKNKKINFSYLNHLSNPIIKKNFLIKNEKITKKCIKNIFKNLKFSGDNFHFLSKNFKFNFDIEQLKRFNKFKSILIVGMGGSVLGSNAIYQFLGKKEKKKFIFFDNLKENNFENISKKNTLFIIISKSGNTIETLINLNLLTKFKVKKLNTIIVTENANNALNDFAKKRKILLIEHKKYIGGRYSVLSEVGMIPAYFMNLDINKFRKNLLDYLSTKKKLFLKASTNRLAQFYLSKKYNSIIFLNYCPQLEQFTFWCQQLLAESLGKKNKGLMPIVSVAPKDHHSLLQLYLDGPKDKLFYIFSSKDTGKLKPKNNLFGKKFNFLNNKSINKVVNAQKEALIKSLKKRKIPFREFHVNNFSEACIGELFSYFMLETVIIGKLIKVNPFDQLAVEEVKVNTKKILS